MKTIIVNAFAVFNILLWFNVDIFQLQPLAVALDDNIKVIVVRAGKSGGNIGGEK